MRKLFVGVLLILSIGTTKSQEFNPFHGPKPIAVLIQTNPWLMCIGSDTPMIAIYEDGQVIYLEARDDGRRHYVCKHLTQKELQAVKDTLASFGSYADCRSSYNIAKNVSDQPETNIFLNLDSTTFVTKVYGLMIKGTKLPGYTVFSGGDEPDQLPETVSRIHKYLIRLEFNDSQQWVPEYIEVMIWPYEYAPDESIHWPDDWPGLDSPFTLGRNDAYSIYLPGDQLDRLRDFLKTRKEKGAVEIGGKKWAVAARRVFPSEPIWRRAFRQP